MNVEQLLARIRLGEDGALELKELTSAGQRVVTPSRDEIADELAALANARGGLLVLGVSDKTREVTGIAPDALDVAERFVSEVCTDSLKPPLAPDIRRLALPGLDGGERFVIAVDVPRSLFVHQSPGGYFYRVGSSKRRMAPDFLARLFQQRSQTRLLRFDEQLVASATLDTLDEALWRRFETPRTRDAREDLLRKLGMARTDEDGTWRPTVAGVLMATRDPREHLPSAFVQAVAYRGTSVVPQGSRDLYQLDARDITGPLDEQVFESCRFVHRNMKVAATKDLGRRDLPQYDLTAVFEAMVNAVAHRDYSIHGSKIRLRLFADRMEVYSPGGIANTMGIESLPYRQAARNETLTSLLAKCAVPSGVDWLATDRDTLMDRRGEGVQIILQRSESLSGRQPEYRLIDDTELLLTIYAANGDAA